MRTKQLKAHSEHINGLTDEEIIMLIHQGSGQALDYLIHKYKTSFVRSHAHTFLLVQTEKILFKRV